MTASLSLQRLVRIRLTAPFEGQAGLYRRIAVGLLASPPP